MIKAFVGKTGNTLGSPERPWEKAYVKDIEIKNQIIPQAATETPQPNGTESSVGTSEKYAREDHIHPIPDNLRSITFGTEEYEDGVTDLATNQIYLQYE